MVALRTDEKKDHARLLAFGLILIENSAVQVFKWDNIRGMVSNVLLIGAPGASYVGVGL